VYPACGAPTTAARLAPAFAGAYDGCAMGLRCRGFAVIGLAVALSAAVAGITPPAVPAEVAVTVHPDQVAPGGRVRVTVQLTPIEGVKINRYPQIKLAVAERAGLVGEAQATVGSTVPPPPDKLKSNYFERVDPLELELSLAPGAPAGRQELPAALSYFYCLPASGFCAPKRLEIKIPLTIAP
jgi:hypothetical protein